MIKAIIVDDEKAAIKSLVWELENFCEDITIVDTFTNPKEAISAINYIKPECVFLDIEMPQMDGFHLLERLDYRDFDLIITTAYDSYALKAFKENAIDYLLKPIDTDDLIKSVSKIKINKKENNLGNELKELLENFPKSQNQNKIAISLSGKTLFVKPEEILYCKSDGGYTEVHFVNKKKEVISKKLKDVEQYLNNFNFYRVHNSYIVNTNYINEFIKTDGNYIVLENNISIPVSRAKKDELIEKLTN